MKSEDTTYYIVYKTSDDRHGGIECMYGWTTNKSVLNAFLKQRRKNKYTADRIYVNATKNALRTKQGLIEFKYLDIDLDDKLMIDILPLKSGQSGDIVKLFSTDEEKTQIVNDIDNMFDELRSFQRVDDISDIKSMVDTYRVIRDKYVNALETIGYRPMEVEYMYDSVDDIYHDVNYGIGYQPDGEDESILDNSHNYVIHKSVIYSLESVIKVLKNELL